MKLVYSVNLTAWRALRRVQHHDVSSYMTYPTSWRDSCATLWRVSWCYTMTCQLHDVSAVVQLHDVTADATPWRVQFHDVTADATPWRVQLHDVSSSMTCPVPWRDSWCYTMTCPVPWRDSWCYTMTCPAPWRVQLHDVSSSMMWQLMLHHDVSSSMTCPAPWRVQLHDVSSSMTWQLMLLREISSVIAILIFTPVNDLLWPCDDSHFVIYYGFRLHITIYNLTVNIIHWYLVDSLTNPDRMDCVYFSIMCPMTVQSMKMMVF